MNDALIGMLLGGLRSSGNEASVGWANGYHRCDLIQWFWDLPSAV
jgi:hypothetical protein